jgi:hypothetical protein
MPRKKNILSDWTPVDPNVKRTVERSSWSSEIIDAFLAQDEDCLAKEFADEDELRRKLANLRTYLGKHEELKAQVKVGKKGTMLVLRKIK